MGQGESSVAEGAGKASSRPSTGKIAQRKATEAEIKRAERDQQKQARDAARKVAMDVAAAQKAERDASRAKPLAPPKGEHLPPRAKKTPSTTNAVSTAKPKQKSSACPRSTATDDMQLPPEVAALMLPVSDLGDDDKDDESIAMMYDALAAAQAALMVDVSDEEEEDDPDDPAASVSSPTDGNRAKKRRNEIEDIENVSLHSSDYRDEDLMGQLAELEEEAEAERQAKISEYEVRIAQLKQEALALMKGGDKPNALVVLKKAKDLEKERDAMALT